ncbi:MAG: prolipoprotein diacylglyceryl transferase [Patescibacteria group bacterium]
MYGAIISLAIAISVYVAEKYFLRKKMSPEIMWEGLFWGILTGLVGARLFHVISLWSFYEVNPTLIIQFWQGGLNIFGGILGFLVAISLYLKSKKQKVLPWLDVAAQVTPLGQALGRWANYINKEIYGPETNLPWGININGYKHHPLFLYEMILDLWLFSLLILIKTKVKKVKKGTFLYVYLAGYSTIRILLEDFRLQKWEWRSLNITNTIALVLIVYAGTMLFKIYRKRLNVKLIFKALATTGIIISLYLTYTKISGVEPLCGVGTCEIVQNSRYATMLGIPTALYGVFYYIVFYILAEKSLNKQLSLLILVGLIFSAYLAYLELFIINAFCKWCVGSLLVILLASGIQYIRIKYDNIHNR